MCYFLKNVKSTVQRNKKPCGRCGHFVEAVSEWEIVNELELFSFSFLVTLSPILIRNKHWTVCFDVRNKLNQEEPAENLCK